MKKVKSDRKIGEEIKVKSKERKNRLINQLDYSLLSQFIIEFPIHTQTQGRKLKQLLLEGKKCLLISNVLWSVKYIQEDKGMNEREGNREKEREKRKR